MNRSASISLKTKHGLVMVEFKDDGGLLDIFVYGDSTYTKEIWKRERPRLVRLAKQYCKEISEKRGYNGCK